MSQKKKKKKKNPKVSPGEIVHQRILQIKSLSIQCACFEMLSSCILGFLRHVKENLVP